MKTNRIHIVVEPKLRKWIDDNCKSPTKLFRKACEKEGYVEEKE